MFRTILVILNLVLIIGCASKFREEKLEDITVVSIAEIEKRDGINLFVYWPK